MGWLDSVLSDLWRWYQVLREKMWQPTVSMLHALCVIYLLAFSSQAADLYILNYWNSSFCKPKAKLNRLGATDFSNLIANMYFWSMFTPVYQPDEFIILRPQFGGRYCTGRRIKYKACNTQVRRSNPHFLFNTCKKFLLESILSCLHIFLPTNRLLMGAVIYLSCLTNSDTVE